jgi:ribosomal protein S18 acetylase RimI-like enzyme
VFSTGEIRLDNPVYAALSSAHARFARSRGRVLAYEADFAPFLAFPAEPTATDWADAAGLVGPGRIAAVLHSGLEPAEPWQPLRDYETVQMVGDGIAGSAEPEAIPLGPADVREMLALARETEPGPFLQRTVELGTYLGIRRDGALVAMAGERFHFDGWREISGVCTAPSHRGEGLASRLVGALIDGILARGERPFLHVLTSNAGAIRIYERLGFHVRRDVTVTAMRAGPAMGD